MYPWQARSRGDLGGQMVLLITGLLLPESIMGRAGAKNYKNSYLIAFDCGLTFLCVLTAASLLRLVCR